MCRSPWRSQAGFSAAADTMRKPAWPGTCYRTTCCSCSRSWPWSRPRPLRRTPCATRRKILHAVRLFTPEEVETFVERGQYARGIVDGKEVPGYRQEERVATDSVTPTYVGVRFEIDNWRWAGVPFYLR